MIKHHLQSPETHTGSDNWKKKQMERKTGIQQTEKKESTDDTQAAQKVLSPCVKKKRSKTSTRLKKKTCVEFIPVQAQTVKHKLSHFLLTDITQQLILKLSRKDNQRTAKLIINT